MLRLHVSPMTILDHLMPAWDARRVERRVIDGPFTLVLRSASTTDFLDAVRQNGLVKVLFALRSTAERIPSVLLRRRFEEPPTPATSSLNTADAERGG